MKSMSGRVDGPIAFVQHIIARDDIRGNRRRIWVGYNDEGRATAICPERPDGGMPPRFKDVPRLLSHNVSAEDYYALIRLGERWGALIQP
jgi:hypothetical protein